MGGFNPSGDSAAPPVFRLSVGLPLILMSLFGLGFSSGVVGLGFVIFFWGGGGGSGWVFGGDFWGLV